MSFFHGNSATLQRLVVAGFASCAIIGLSACGSSGSGSSNTSDAPGASMLSPQQQSKKDVATIKAKVDAVSGLDNKFDTAMRTICEFTQKHVGNYELGERFNTDVMLYVSELSSSDITLWSEYFIKATYLVSWDKSDAAKMPPNTYEVCTYNQ